ncbi:MAG: hypothetical protein PHH13_00470 [Candidatus Peribacteraceae bacterium]|nr:hypothetical protein [Candidatus Peribacteraceae bacterium]
MVHKKAVSKVPARKRARKMGAVPKSRVPKVQIAVWGDSKAPFGVDSKVLIGTEHQPRHEGIIVDLNRIARFGGHATKLPEFVEALCRLFGVKKNCEMRKMLDALNAAMFAAGRDSRCSGCCDECSGKCYR